MIMLPMLEVRAEILDWESRDISFLNFDCNRCPAPGTVIPINNACMFIWSSLIPRLFTHFSK